MTRRLFKTRPARILAFASVVVTLIATAMLWIRFDRVTVIREMQARSTRVDMQWYGESSSSDPTSALLPVHKLFLTNPTAADMAGLAKFPEIRFLCLTDGTLNNKSLRVLTSLPNLTTIWFEDVEGIDDQGLEILGLCKQLKAVQVYYAWQDVTGSFLEALRDHVRLNELEVRFCSDFDGSSLKALALQTELQTVVFTDCYLDGTGFEVFQHLKKLKRVEIDLPDESLRKYFLHVPDAGLHKPEPEPGYQ